MSPSLGECRCREGQCPVHAYCGHLWSQTRRGNQEGTYTCPACEESTLCEFPDPVLGIEHSWKLREDIPALDFGPCGIATYECSKCGATAVSDPFTGRIQSAEADLISEAHVNASPGPATVEPGVTTKAPGSPDREQVLEVMLDQAVSTIEFLHGCLAEPHIFSYNYPAHTWQCLKDFRSILPRREWCVHSKTVEGCAGCVDRIRARSILAAWRDSLPNGTTT